MPGKKEKPMANKMDFDFSGISGKRSQKTSDKKRQENKNTVGKEPGKVGISITVPREEGGWDSMDLSECSPEQFRAWCHEVWPVPLSVDDDKLKSLKVKVQIFKQLMHNHMNLTFQIGKNPKEKKENLIH